MKTNSRPISPWRAAAILLLAAGVALLVAVLLLELVFGSWLRNNPWERALALNIVTDRKIVFDATGLYEGGGPVLYTRDRYGLRGNFKDPAEITILTIGGSTTDQRYIGDGQTWQDVLERDLRAAGRSETVANAGVDGHSTFAHLAAYRDWLPLVPGLKPKVTLLYVGLNDLFLASPRGAFEGDMPGQPTLKSRFKANSALFRLYVMARGALAARRLGIDHQPTDFRALRYTEKGLLGVLPDEARASTVAFAGRLTELLARVHEQGSLPVCVTQPSQFYRVGAEGRVEGVDQPVTIPNVTSAPMNGVDYYRLRKAQDQAMIATCQAAGAPVIDLASQTWETADFYDLVHNSPRGARKVGDRIAAALAALPP